MYGLNPNLADIIPESPEKMGIVAMLIVGIAALVRGWVVPGNFYSDMKAQNDRVRAENEQLRAENGKLKAENDLIRQQLVRPAFEAVKELAQKVQPPAA